MHGWYRSHSPCQAALQGRQVLNTSRSVDIGFNTELLSMREKGTMWFSETQLVPLCQDRLEFPCLLLCPPQITLQTFPWSPPHHISTTDARRQSCNVTTLLFFPRLYYQRTKLDIPPFPLKQLLT